MILTIKYGPSSNTGIFSHGIIVLFNLDVLSSFKDNLSNPLTPQGLRRKDILDLSPHFKFVWFKPPSSKYLQNVETSQVYCLRLIHVSETYIYCSHKTLHPFICKFLTIGLNKFSRMYRFSRRSIIYYH